MWSWNYMNKRIQDQFLRERLPFKLIEFKIQQIKLTMRKGQENSVVGKRKRIYQ